MSCLLATLVLLNGSVGILTDDEIKIELKTAKFQAAFEGGEKLLGYDEQENRIFFYVNGAADFKVKVPAEGEYILKLKASCQASNKEFAKLSIIAGGKSVADEFALTQEDEKEYTFTLKFPAGEQKISISYTNDEYKEGAYDRNLYLHAVIVKKK